MTDTGKSPWVFMTVFDGYGESPLSFVTFFYGFRESPLVFMTVVCRSGDSPLVFVTANRTAEMPCSGQSRVALLRSTGE